MGENNERGRLVGINKHSEQTLIVGEKSIYPSNYHLCCFSLMELWSLVAGDDGHGKKKKKTQHVNTYICLCTNKDYDAGKFMMSFSDLPISGNLTGTPSI